ncbi:thiol-disulfide oxidoreductase DCC family protein [Blastococcus sp. SYSU DS0617]
MLIYDADCGFCTRSATWIARGGKAFPLQAWQFIDDLADYGLTFEDVATAAYWIEADGAKLRGSDAIGRALVQRGGVWKVAGRAIMSRPVRPLARWVYGHVATNRHRMPGGTSACRVDLPPAV